MTSFAIRNHQLILRKDFKNFPLFLRHVSCCWGTSMNQRRRGEFGTKKRSHSDAWHGASGGEMHIHYQYFTAYILWKSNIIIIPFPLPTARVKCQESDRNLSLDCISLCKWFFNGLIHNISWCYLIINALVSLSVDILQNICNIVLDYASLWYRLESQHQPCAKDEDITKILWNTLYQKPGSIQDESAWELAVTWPWSAVLNASQHYHVFYFI